ncbi:hypothetical protein ACFTZK_18665 [Streptomyces decoyicus]|uniref:hypothetical protein n=1 Tax=Streptomyces decoyicus TaxID=249567 RepID=UPI00362B01DF
MVKLAPSWAPARSREMEKFAYAFRGGVLLEAREEIAHQGDASRRPDAGGQGERFLRGSCRMVDFASS